MNRSSIMSIREIIDAAFGEQDVNKVNFKLIQTVLYILARQLRLLERQVGINIDPGVTKQSSSISITEVKIQAKVAKPKKSKGSKSVNHRDDSRAIAVEEKSEPEGKKTLKGQPIKATFTEQKNADKAERGQKNDEALGKKTSKTTKEDQRKEDFEKYIEEMEQVREYELRVVHQRANSKEQAKKSPTPMASLDSLEYMQYEKLLLVDRVSKEEAMKQIETQRLQIVTQEQFDELHKKVKALEKQFEDMSADLPDLLQQMKELEEKEMTNENISTPLVSTRLKTAETTITQLMDIVTDFATKKRLENKGKPNMTTESRSSRLARKSNQDTTPAGQKQWTTLTDLDNDLLVIEEDIMNQVKNITDKTVATAENALTVARNLEKELDSALNLGNGMKKLENIVSEYTDKINTLDTNLSSQMSNYQEQLTQMQHDLESGIESMLESAANITSDPIAVAELNTNFSNLQSEMDFTNMKQKKLEENQKSLSLELKGLLMQLELLRGVKTDRDEVIDALRGKVGLDTLNGLVNEKQFEAVRLDFEKQIKAAYNKFNSQEIQWQRAIDDLQCKLDDKADTTVLEALRYDIDNNLNTLKKRIDEIKDIVGEPSAAAVSKVLLRDTTCISCLTPANIDPTETDMIPSLPASRNPKSAGTFTTTKEKDNLCFPGKPKPYPIDANDRVCHRYCGGSHTMTSNARSKLTATVRTISAFQDVERDGKAHTQHDLDVDNAPCVPCNFVAITQSLKFENDDAESEMSHDFFKHRQVHNTTWQDIGSITPPYFIED